MDKCWFVLRQTHYPPPKMPVQGTTARATGAICLGHIIPDLKHLDQVLNSEYGPEPYPASMTVYETTKWDMKWDISSSSTNSATANVGVPTGVLPVDMNTSVSAAFKKSVRNFWEFERLDTAIVQPTRAYVDDSLEDGDVEAFLNRKKVLGLKPWTLYMISGIAIARGARVVSNEESESNSMHADAGVNVPGAAGGGISGEVGGERGTKANWNKASDFVWAVRLARISKGLFHGDKQWKMETVAKGATFSKEDGDGDGEGKEVNAEDELTAEGMDLDHGVNLYKDSKEDMFVVPRDDGKEEVED